MYTLEKSPYTLYFIKRTEFPAAENTTVPPKTGPLCRQTAGKNLLGPWQFRDSTADRRQSMEKLSFSCLVTVKEKKEEKKS